MALVFKILIFDLINLPVDLILTGTIAKGLVKIPTKSTQALATAGLNKVEAVKLKKLEDSILEKVVQSSLNKSVGNVVKKPLSEAEWKALGDTSFGKRIKSLKNMSEAVSTYITRAAEKIRNEKLVANNISLYIRTNPFNKNPSEYYANSISIPLNFPTNNTITLNKEILIGLKKIFKKGYLYQKAGVILSGLEVENIDLNLFKEDNKKKIF